MRASDRPLLALATYDQAPQLNPDDHPLQAALEARGVQTVAVVWDDPAVEWQRFDAVLIRSIWDYFQKFDAYNAWLDHLQALGVPTINPVPVLRWNSDKRYLATLAEAGIPMPATRHLRGAALAALAQTPGEWIVKPAVSGGAWHTVRGTGGSPDFQAALAQLPADLDFLVQPYLPEIASAGEWSLLYFGGQFSHAVLKRPAAGDFRVQAQFGGSTTTLPAPAAAMTAASHVLATAASLLGEPLHYARVDGVMIDGEFQLMELEVIEPFLFMAQHPQAPDRCADALVTALRKRDVAAAAA